MGKKLFVGNLDFGTTGEDLEQLFSQYGAVQTADLVSDRDTGRSRGFGFVEMATEEEAKAAIAALNETEFKGRTIAVNEAKPKTDRGGGGGRSGGGGGRGGFGGGGGRSGGGGNRGGGGGGRDGGGRRGW